MIPVDYYAMLSQATEIIVDNAQSPLIITSNIGCYTPPLVPYSMIKCNQRQRKNHSKSFRKGRKSSNLLASPLYTNRRPTVCPMHHQSEWASPSLVDGKKYMSLPRATRHPIPCDIAPRMPLRVPFQW